MKKVICFAALCLLLAGCAAAPVPQAVEPTSSTAVVSESVSSAQSAKPDTPVETKEEMTQRLLSERGLLEWQIKSLTNQSFLLEEMFELTDEQLAEIFAPGSNYDGRELEEGELEERLAALAPYGIDEKRYMVLMGLGYTYEELPTLTKGELDFIFPNTTLFERLIAAGAMPAGSDLSSPLPDGCESYRDVIYKAYFLSSTQVGSTP